MIRSPVALSTRARLVAPEEAERLRARADHARRAFRPTGGFLLDQPVSRLPVPFSRIAKR